MKHNFVKYQVSMNLTPTSTCGVLLCQLQCVAITVALSLILIRFDAKVRLHFSNGSPCFAPRMLETALLMTKI